MTIAECIESVRARIERVARAAGRDAAEVKLVAVSKTRSPEAVREAYAAGQRLFGENYAQELAAKAASLADLSEIEWHFVGHLQTNKAKLVAARAAVVHTVDSAALARELGKRAARDRTQSLPVLVSVNLGNEPQKSGATPSEIDEVLAEIARQPSLAARGLMTLPPSGDLGAARKVFDALVSLRNLHGGRAVLPELSMGMSHDLEVAVACGATYVRVGSAIFGER